jgi:cupin 2 domain-containing protein
MNGNLLADLPVELQSEQFLALLERPGVQLERIVSHGQATPPGEWLSQPQDEWVLLLAGAARLTLEGQDSFALGPGDHVLIPAGQRHRVDWTQPNAPTVWLALHLG